MSTSTLLSCVNYGLVMNLSQKARLRSLMMSLILEFDFLEHDLDLWHGRSPSLQTFESLLRTSTRSFKDAFWKLYPTYHRILSLHKETQRSHSRANSKACGDIASENTDLCMNLF